MTERILPTGTVTFLMSDIERSTQLVQQVGPADFTDIIDRHNEVLRRAFREHAGTERGTQGDSFLVMFTEAPAAVAAAVDVQRGLASVSWPQDVPVRVRIGVHTGVATLGGDDYVGIDVHRVARICAASHGGQVLVSETTHSLAAHDLPAGVSLRRLGDFKLRDLSQPERLSQLVIEGLLADFPSITTGRASAGNLPGRFAAVIGRDEALRDLEALVAERRLVTLTGPGGIGKTSLALELAHRSASTYPDGAWFVPLDPLSDPSLVASAIAGSLGLVEAPGQSGLERLDDFLRDRTVLVVLDNFEHLMPAASTVAHLLEASPGLTVVATSRAPLHLAAEQEYPVPPLQPPDELTPDDAENAAVRVFIDRARRVRPGYAPSGDEAAAIGEICRRLDGLPLGIQLAASRVSLLPARSIAARLAEQLPLPAGGATDAPRRQQSLDQAIAWSEQLLDDAARRLLARLSVFRGGFRLEEASAVGLDPEQGGDVLDGLSVLVDQSLVQPIPGPEAPRYRLLEPIRAYATRRLAASDEREAVERRHAHAYRDLAEAAAPHVPGRGQRAWLNRLDAERDNLRAAITWTIEHTDTDTALRLGAAMWRFWQQRGHVQEGLDSMARILEMSGAEEPTSLRVRALEALGGLQYWGADLPGADGSYRSQLELARSIGDVRGEADALFNLGHTQFLAARDNEAADRMAEDAGRLYRQLGDERSLARLQWTVVNRRMERGEPMVEAEMRAALHRFEELGDDWYMAMASGTLAWIAFAAGNLHDGLRWCLDSVTRHHAMGDVASPTIALRYMAIIFQDLGRPEAAAAVGAAYESLCSRYGVQPPAFFEELTPALGRRELDDTLARHPEAAARGAAMSLDETIDLIDRVASELLAPEE